MASAIILAGGQGKRLGRIDKSTIAIGGQTLLERQLAVVEPLVDEIVLVANQPRAVPSGVRLAIDLYPGKGALGGLYTGLAAAGGSSCLTLACDLPFLERSLLAYMLELAAEFDAVVPRTADGIHPLVAVYSRSCLDPIEPLLDQDRLRIIGFYDRVRLRFVDEPEIERLDPAHLTFFNVNTPEDLARAEAIAALGVGSERHD